ncbi:MAG: Lrp/AsnC family transcriptional regulator [Steroidobacteraceae bacterium]
MTEENAKLDRLDRVILRELRNDARMSFRDLGLKAGLSANAIAERVRRLISTRVIRGFHADLNLTALGYRLFAFVDIKTGAKAGPDMLEEALAELPEVQRATWTTGNFDFTLEVACKDQEDLVRLIEKLRERVPISETYTRLIGRELFDGKHSVPELGR